MAHYFKDEDRHHGANGVDLFYDKIQYTCRIMGGSYPNSHWPRETCLGNIELNASPTLYTTMSWVMLLKTMIAVVLSVYVLIV